MHKLHELGCNNATIPISTSLSGNIIPNNWYKKITTNSGRPDLSAIMILAEIVYWYRPGKDGNKKFKDDAWQTSYEYFENKFGYNRQKIRRTFVRLEELGFIKRELRIIKHYGQKYGNVLFIHLIAYESLSSKPFDKQLKGEKKISSNPFKNDDPLLQNCIDNIDIENKHKRNRSNFLNGKSFEDFYPISKSDLETLSHNSNREFDLNAVNEILLSLAKKLPNHKFRNHKSFINYMSKALSHEMRQAEKVNNKEFKININKTDQDKEVENREKLLDQIESSKDNSQISLLKKKIIGRFDEETSFKVLKSLSSIEILEAESKIFFDKAMKLPKFAEDIIKQEFEIITGISEIKIEFLNVDQEAKTYSKPSILWEKIRNKAKEKLGEDIDNSWFSRLNISISDDNKIAKIKADSSFIRDWTQNNYKDFIERHLEAEGIKLYEIS